MSMTHINRDKFYAALEEVFTGARIEGEGGFVNLLKIKSAYYRDVIRKRFDEEVSKDERLSDDFEEDFFRYLYSFFEKYFSESGSVYFVKTAHWQRVYERVYTDNRDVMLFWKTHMLYYVKSDILFQNMEIAVPGISGENRFFFDVSALPGKQNNEKKELLFEFKGKRADGVVVIAVNYAVNGRKTKTDDMEKKSGVPGETLEKAFNTFRKQSQVDFFINKNARAFLSEQLDIYLHQILLDDRNKFNQRRLDQIKAVKEYAEKIIDFIAQFEDELVLIWSKPKFVRACAYVITLDKLSDTVIAKLAKHSGMKAQAREWRELGMVAEGFDFSRRWLEHAHLPIDTKYFKDLEIEILGQFDDLDAALDGVLIHSENYQALNTLKDKYRGKVDCVYIDPPYNAKSSEIPYENTFKHSSWLSLMENRLSASQLLLGTSCVNVIAIDEIENFRLGLLLEKTFANCEDSTISIQHNPTGQQGENFSFTHDFAHFVFPKGKSCIGVENRNDAERIAKPDVRPLRNVSSGVNHFRTSAANCFYPIFIKKEKIVDFGDVCVDDFHPNGINEKQSDGTIAVYPIDPNGNESKWVFARDTVESIVSELTPVYNPKKNIWDIIRTKSSLRYKSLWTDKRYSANSYGSVILNNMFENTDFQFPKSLYTVIDCIDAALNNNSTGLVLDYFAGSGTTAHAVMCLNRQDGGKRKYILVEMGDYFDTVLVPRIKKAAFSDKWKGGRAQPGGQGQPQFFKYYTLEQYEDVLRRSSYTLDRPLRSYGSGKKFFSDYIFRADQKFADVLNVGGGKISLDFDKLYSDIDFAQTISNLKGLPIRRITKDAVVLTRKDGAEITINTNHKAMTEDEKLVFARLLKPLLWWGR